MVSMFGVDCYWSTRHKLAVARKAFIDFGIIIVAFAGGGAVVAQKERQQTAAGNGQRGPYDMVPVLVEAWTHEPTAFKHAANWFE
mmetsp:Transcript_13992/g.19241  ORF Transcript_13992/g.19241 Transcript_13992/m.19241 type:complete len:85 (+) Transcript_13992:102-356(+)